MARRLAPRLALLVSALAGCARGDAAKAKSATAGDVTLVATAELKGTTEPCGCNSDPLGDVARVTALAQGGLLVDGGNLLYDPEQLASPERLPQAEAKARCLETVYASALVGLGGDDLARGADHVKLPRLAVNVHGGVLTVEPRVVVKNGVAFGVFGVVAPSAVEGVQGVTADPPVPAAKAAIAALQQKKAQVIVALLDMPRTDARALMTAAPGITFGITAQNVGDGMEEPEQVGPATHPSWLMAPADQGRKAVRLAVHLVKDSPLNYVLGAEAVAVKRARMERRIAILTSQLAGWQHDPTADPTFVAARRAELAQLQSDYRSEAAPPAPPSGQSYFSYALVPIKRALPRDPAVAATMKQLDHTIGQANFAAAQHLAPPPAEKGTPTYVGQGRCIKCHQGAAEFWKHTVHATAWKTLVDVDKQYNYDCIGCHVTGWQKPGGVNMGNAEKAQLTDVQCEVCHGPGSVHVAEDGLDDPRTIQRTPPERLCADTCHVKEHSDTFDRVAYLRDILGKGHGEKLRQSLGDGPTGHELRSRALAAH